jgi:hypothetical protein
VFRFLVTVNVVPSSLIPFTLMMQAIHSSEISVLTRVTQRNIPEDDIFHIQLYIPGDGSVHNRRCERFKSYINNDVAKCYICPLHFQVYLSLLK